MMLLKWRMTKPSMWFNSSTEPIGGTISLGPQILEPVHDLLSNTPKKSEVDELQAGIELSPAVLPQPPVLLQSGKAAFDHPPLGDHRKLVQFAALGNLHRDVLAQDLLSPSAKCCPT